MPLNPVWELYCHNTLERGLNSTWLRSSPKNLLPADQNYNVGNQELLVVKLALEEWCHWLDGAAYPFTVFMISQVF